MKKDEVIASIIMEQVSDPMKPQNLDLVQLGNGLAYCKFYTNLQDWNKKNRNGRIYTDGAMIPALQASYIHELIRKGSFAGELGHPLSKDPARILTIDPKLISHRITKLDVDRFAAKGWVESLMTDQGQNFTKMILQGFEPAFSLRALASITRRGGEQLIESQARVVCYDVVILPSHEMAYRDETVQIEWRNAIEKTGNTVTESIVSPLLEGQFINFLKEDSANLNIISNQYEISTECMTLSKDLKNMIVTEGDRSYIVKMDDFAKKEINSYMKNFVL